MKSWRKRLAVVHLAAATPLMLLMLNGTPAKAQTSVRSDTALNELVDAFMKAQRGHDQAKLAELTTSDYVEVSPIGDVDPREEMLGFYAPEKKRPAPPMTISERTVRQRGDHALVLVRIDLTVPGPGGTVRQIAMRASFVARRSAGRWKLAATQYTPIPARKP